MERGLDFKGLFFILAIGAISLLVIFSLNRPLFYNQLIIKKGTVQGKIGKTHL